MSESRLSTKLKGGVGLLVAVLGIALLLAPTATVSQASSDIEMPGDSAMCAACHPEPTESWAGTPHRRAVGAPHIAEDMQGCTGCHREAAKHLEDPSAYTPQATFATAKENADLCLSCHKQGAQSFWRFSKHAQLEQACNTCHDPHNADSRNMLREDEPELCASCHAQQIAEGQLPSHHPIEEGKMVCSDCHNVHGDQRGNVGRENNAEMCYRCHAEKEGPFTYEHAPVTEDCTICHRPHGSPNNKLLVVEQPMLCLQCHPGHHDSHRSPLISADPNDPVQFMDGLNSFYAKCTTCHSLIHGTDLPSGTNNGTFMPGRPASPQGSTDANRGGTVLGIAGLTLLGNLMDGVGLEYFGFSDLWAGSEDADDNQQYVREYDGTDYETVQLDSAHRLLDEEHLMTIKTKNLGGDDQEIALYYANPQTSMDLDYSELTHRLDRKDFYPDALIEGNSVSHTDLTNGFNDFRIERATAEAKLSYRTPKADNVRWNLNYWSEREKGRQQHTFLERCTDCHQVSTMQIVDRQTSTLDMGADVTLGTSSLSYNHSMRKFENRADEQWYNFAGSFSVYAGDAPLFGVADTVSTYDEVRMVMPAGENLHFNGLYRKGDRENRYSDINLGIESTTGNVAYFLGDAVKLSGGYSSSSLNTEADGNTDRKIKVSRVQLDYLGIPNLDISLGFRNEDIDRESHHELAPRNSDSDILTASADWRPGTRFNLRAQYRDTDTDNKANEDLVGPIDYVPSRWIARPNDGEQWQVQANYMASEKMILSGLYTSLKDDWMVSELGISAESRNDITTAGLSLAYLPSQKGRLTASYYRQEGDTDSDVTYGNGTYTLGLVDFPPIESTARYDYDASILMLRGDCNLSSGWRFFGSVSQTETDGSVLTRNIGDYFDQDLDVDDYDITFNPFDITILDWWLGMGYRLNPTTELTLSYQSREWENDDNSVEDGDVRIWRFGVNKRF